MNNILMVEDVKNIKEDRLELKFTGNATLNIENEVTIFNIDEENKSILVNLASNSNLKFEKVNYLTADATLEFNLKDNCKLDLNLLVINENINTLTLNINMLGNNGVASIQVRALNKNKNSKLNLICNGYIKEATKDNELTEDLKGLIQNTDEIKISPNMYVKTSEVIANHKVALTSFNKETLFYLNSRTLSLKQAQKLILKSFKKQGFSMEMLQILKWR